MKILSTKITSIMADSESGPAEFTERDFARLYSAQAALVRSVIFQIAGTEALDDLVQESFVKIWRSMKSFRGEARVSSWIYRIATNTALDWIRKNGKQPELFDATIDVAGADSPSQTVTNRDLVSKGLMSLSLDHRTVLVFALLHDLPLAEIAEILEISEGTVKSRLHYAKAEFKAFLEREGVKP